MGCHHKKWLWVGLDDAQHLSHKSAFVLKDPGASQPESDVCDIIYMHFEVIPQSLSAAVFLL